MRLTNTSSATSAENRGHGLTRLTEEPAKVIGRDPNFAEGGE